MMTCHDVAYVLSAGDLEDSGLWRRLRVWIHLAMCRHCRRFRRQLARLGGEAQSLAEELSAEMPPDLADRVVQRLRRP